MAGTEQQAVAVTEEEASARWSKISEQIEEIWSEVLVVANNVLKVHAKFGFTQFSENISPSLEDILLSLQVVESMLDTVGASGTLEYSETRKVGNAKQQILWIQTIGNALKYGNQEDYEASISKLGGQSKI
jgi:hypothetical protein